MTNLGKTFLCFFPCIAVVTSSFCSSVALSPKRKVALLSLSENESKLYGTSSSSATTTTTAATTTVPIIACSSNIELERAIAFYVKPNDVVLELGSQLNDISRLICSKITNSGDSSREEEGGFGPVAATDDGGGHAVLFGLGLSKDAKSGRVKSRSSNLDSFLERCHENDDRAVDGSDTKFSSPLHDRVTFKELEQFDQWRDVFNIKLKDKAIDSKDMESATATTKSNVSYDVMVLDLGTMIGNDLYLTALSIANEFIAYHKQQEKRIQSNNNDTVNQRRPRVILIKSKILSNLARRLIHSQRLLNGSSYMAKKVRANTLSSSFNRIDDDSQVVEVAEEAPLKYTPRSSTPYIIATVGVNEYRRTIPHVVRFGDEIIEVGCHFGQSTVLLHEAATKSNICDSAIDDSSSTKQTKNKGFCIGVDIGPKIIEHACLKYPEVNFFVGNAWNLMQLLLLKAQLLKDKSMSPYESFSLGYDLVYADIGGLSGPDGVIESLSLLESIGNGLEPRVIVIKSLCMNRLSSQLMAFSDVWSKIK